MPNIPRFSDEEHEAVLAAAFRYAGLASERQEAGESFEDARAQAILLAAVAEKIRFTMRFIARREGGP
jgi:hypothetical protein